jgi:hypothetical protein
MNAEVDDIIKPTVGGDIAEEVHEIDNDTLTTYLRNNYVTVPDKYDFKKSPSEIASELVAETNTSSWAEIIGILTYKPAPRTPERPPGQHDGSSGATGTGPTLNDSMRIDDGSGSGSGTEGQPLSALPASQGGRRLRFTIRRRSESRQTKKNRRRRVIDVRI